MSTVLNIILHVAVAIGLFVAGYQLGYFMAKCDNYLEPLREARRKRREKEGKVA